VKGVDCEKKNIKFSRGYAGAIYGNGNWCCVLRSDGVAERAIFVIDKEGIIRYIDVHNINQRPPLEVLVRELEKLN